MKPSHLPHLSEAHLSAVLTEHGHKLTRPRRAVLKVIAASTHSLTPAEIHAQAQKHYRQTGLVTVYRTLDLLTECGLVRKIHESDGCHSYAPASAGHAHHIICENCHSVAEFEGCDLDDLFAAVQHRTGYRISGHWLELFGYCPRCQAS
jgi:Fur family transcriptional regulator, ferric uptake regulator